MRRWFDIWLFPERSRRALVRSFFSPSFQLPDMKELSWISLAAAHHAAQFSGTL
jgi:hypothetical protein